jgi:hypothetical protein
MWQWSHCFFIVTPPHYITVTLFFHLEIWNKMLSFELEISKQQYHGKRTRPEERKAATKTAKEKKAEKRDKKPKYD